MPIKYLGFQNLLYRKFVSPGQHDAKKVATAMGESLSTLYNWIEGVSHFPVDCAARLYNATGDIDFLNFILNDTDQMAVPRQSAAGTKDIIAETLDVASATGLVVAGIREALLDGRLSANDRESINRIIDSALRELEDARRAVNADGN